MNIGSEIQRIRSEHGLTQAAFGEIFHVTRQAVSNWETQKTYPDLQTLVEISKRFDISLDALLKEDAQMVKSIDRERMAGSVRRENAWIDMFTGAGTGIAMACMFSPASPKRTVMILVSLAMICVGWYKKARHDKKVLAYMERVE